MTDASRLGYAQARIQARHAARPAPVFWRQLQAGRQIDHLLETLRASPLARAVAGVTASATPHELEARLRQFWVEQCRTTARWHPERWQPALEWLSWLPWLPALTWLERGRAPLAWMQADAMLAPLVTVPADERPAALEAGPLAPLAAAWRDGGALPAAWDSHWRSAWQPVAARHRPGLEALSSIHQRLWPASYAAAGPACDALLDGCEVAALRLFRLHAGSAVAGIAFVTLDWLDILRLRAAVLVASVFADARAA